VIVHDDDADYVETLASGRVCGDTCRQGTTRPGVGHQWLPAGTAWSVPPPRAQVGPEGAKGF